MKVIFKKSHKWGMLNKAINLWTGGYGYSHCEIVFDKVQNVKGKCFSAEPEDGRARWKTINYSDKSKWHVVELDKTLEEELEAYKFAKKIEGKRYDWVGIFLWFIIPISKQHDSKWWCSEICAKMIGIKQFRVHPNKLAKMLGAPKVEK